MNQGEPWLDFEGRRILLRADSLQLVEGITSNQRAAVEFLQAWYSPKDTFVLHTSGSTGKPKPIEVTRNQMVASAKKTAKALGLETGMTALLCLDCRYVAGIMMLVRATTIGMNLIVREPSSNPLEHIASRTLHFAALVPYQFENSLRIIQDPSSSPFAENARIILGGAPVTASSHSVIATLTGISVYATYGMTETLSHVALQRLSHPTQDSFHALEGITFATDERGCLVIEADHLPAPIVTNDLVSLSNPTAFRWLGRWDNIINSGGVKIIPETVEKLIADWMIQTSMHRRFFIAATPHPTLGSQVTLVVEGELTLTEEQSMLAWLKNQATTNASDNETVEQRSVNKYSIPKLVLYAEAFRETATAKVDRTATLKIASPRPQT